MTNKQKNIDLAPKTCSVDRLITLQKDIEKVTSGVKTATRRNGRYADVGEVMTLQGHQYLIDRVYRQTLGELTDADALREGYEDMEHYKQAILSIHPGMPWLPHMKVWVHEFHPIQEYGDETMT